MFQPGAATSQHDAPLRTMSHVREPSALGPKNPFAKMGKEPLSRYSTAPGFVLFWDIVSAARQYVNMSILIQ